MQVLYALLVAPGHQKGEWRFLSLMQRVALGLELLAMAGMHVSPALYVAFWAMQMPRRHS